MEPIFTASKPKKKFIQVMIPSELASKLKALNKGSYSNAIKSLLNIKQDNTLTLKVSELEDSILQIQEHIDKLKRFNPNLRM
jgi:hypothetical protein